MLCTLINHHNVNLLFKYFIVEPKGAQGARLYFDCNSLKFQNKAMASGPTLPLKKSRTCISFQISLVVSLIKNNTK